MKFSMEGFPPVPLPSKMNNIFPMIISNKVCVIRDILKSNKIARESRHFEGNKPICYSVQLDFWLYIQA